MARHNLVLGENIRFFGENPTKAEPYPEYDLSYHCRIVEAHVTFELVSNGGPYPEINGKPYNEMARLVIPVEGSRQFTPYVQQTYGDLTEAAKTFLAKWLIEQGVPAQMPREDAIAYIVLKEKNSYEYRLKSAELAYRDALARIEQL